MTVEYQVRDNTCLLLAVYHTSADALSFAKEWLGAERLDYVDETLYHCSYWRIANASGHAVGGVEKYIDGRAASVDPQ